MNLEFDFELNVPHATHKALGLGWRIYVWLRQVEHATATSK